MCRGIYVTLKYFFLHMKTDRLCRLEDVVPGDLRFYIIWAEMDGSSGLN